MSPEERISKYKELFKSLTIVNGKTVADDIYKMQQMDEMIPQLNTYYFIVNIPLNKYEFVSKNIEFNLGYSLAEITENGGPLFIVSKIHEADIANWLQCLQELFAYVGKHVTLENQERIYCSYNFRVLTKSGIYVNILEHITPLLFDEHNIPVIGISYCTVVATENNFENRGCIRQLNDNEEYETIFYKNYSKPDDQQLTCIQFDILRLLKKGYDVSTIADKLNKEDFFIQEELASLFAIIKCTTTDELVAFFTENFMA